MTKHIAIIGGGIIGLATAWYCRKNGFDVTVIDRNRSKRDGCSFGNAGMLVPSHVVPLAAPGMIKLGLKWMCNPQSPFYIRPRFSTDLLQWLWQFRRSCNAKHVQRSAPVLRDLHLQSRQLYLEMQDALPGGFGLKTHGLLMLCKTTKGTDDEAATAKFANDLGVPADVLDRAATCELDPGIQMDVVGSVYFPKDCHLSPNTLMAALERELEADGCKFHWETECKGFDKHNGKLKSAKTSSGEIEADEFVICGGVWSSELSRELEVALPMQAGKGYSVTLDEPPELPKLCSLLHEARVAVTPIGNSLRVGGTMEIAGLDSSVTESRVQGILKSVPKYFPAFKASDFDRLQPWCGLRPCSPDGLPFIGRSERIKNLVLNTGHAMMGISMAPISGKLVCQVLQNRPASIDNIKTIDPNRYSK